MIQKGIFLNTCISAFKVDMQHHIFQKISLSEARADSFTLIVHVFFCSVGVCVQWLVSLASDQNTDVQ